MAGKHTGVQARIKEINPNAEFVACTNHSLNLACVHAASTAIDSITFFRTIEHLFSFFSSSTHRCEAEPVGRISGLEEVFLLLETHFRRDAFGLQPLR